MPEQLSFLEQRLSFLTQRHIFRLPGGLSIAPNILQAALIVFLVFLLLVTLGQLRHRFNTWTLRGAMPGIGFGFALAIILEGLLLIGGKTILTEVLGWENAPKPVSNVIDAGRYKLEEVLGIEDGGVVATTGEDLSAKTILVQYQKLTPRQADSFRQIVCSHETNRP